MVLSRFWCRTSTTVCMAGRVCRGPIPDGQRFRRQEFRTNTASITEKTQGAAGSPFPAYNEISMVRVLPGDVVWDGGGAGLLLVFSQPPPPSPTSVVAGERVRHVHQGSVSPGNQGPWSDGAGNATPN